MWINDMKVKSIKTIKTLDNTTVIVSEGTIYDVISIATTSPETTLVKILCDDLFKRYLSITNFIELSDWRDNQINNILS